MNSLPVWIQVLQALLTPSIAIGVGFIAYRQWRTAHDKVVLDLFDRRYAIFENVRQAVQKVMNAGYPDQDAQRLLLDSISRADHLFGDDVRIYLHKLYRDFLTLEYTYHDQKIPRSAEERHAQYQRRMAAFRRICRFYEGEANSFRLYLKMDQKRTPTFRERRKAFRNWQNSLTE